jgi:hypothetical protein
MQLLQKRAEATLRPMKHESSFKPASSYRPLARSAYEYKEQGQGALNPRRFRDSEGKVLKPPKNVTTNCHSRVQTEYERPREHMVDPYERRDMLSRAWEKQEKEKILAEPFRVKTCPQ